MSHGVEIRSESNCTGFDDSIKPGAFEVYANNILIYSRLSDLEHGDRDGVMLRSIHSGHSEEELGIKDNFMSTRSN
jgi:hypothetical protein